MKTILMGVIAAAGLWAQQTFDMKTLDNLGANAKESTNITLDANTLKLASSMLSAQGKDNVKSLIDKLKSVTVRSYEYDAEGKYNERDLEPLRAYLEGQKWSRIVDVKDDKEKTQIYMNTSSAGQMGGLAILSAEPKEVTVVLIDGALTMEDLGKLGGNFGIPDVTLEYGAKGKSGKTDRQSGDK